MLQNRLCKKYDVFHRKREMPSIISLYNTLGLCESLTPVKSQPPVSIVMNQHHLRVTPQIGSRLWVLSIQGSNVPVTDLYVYDVV